MSYSNYRNNMPHYDSMPYNYDPMGIHHHMAQSNRMGLANTGSAGHSMEAFLRPFIPDSEIPFEIDGNMPALPRLAAEQIPVQGMPQLPGMPQMLEKSQGGSIHPSLPGILQEGVLQLTCEQLREIMKLMNCPVNGDETNEASSVTKLENGTENQPDGQDI